MKNALSWLFGSSLCLAMILGVPGCTESLPPIEKECDNQTPCPTGKVCDTARNRCVAVDAGIEVDRGPDQTPVDGSSDITDGSSDATDGGSDATDDGPNPTEDGARTEQSVPSDITVPGDTTVTPADITVTPADITVPRDTTVLPADITVPRDTTVTPADITVPHDTGVPPDCTSGVCCDVSTGTYHPNTRTCQTTSQYRCNGTGCGADAQRRTLTQTCSGSSASCDGALKASPWQTSNCADTALCKTDGTSFASCSPCANGCVDGRCKLCSTGPCCNGTAGVFRSAGATCDSWEEFRCTGTGCGADAQSRTVKKTCTGTDAGCNGATTNPAWNTTACAGGQLCRTDGKTYSRCDATCPFGCLNGACKQCSSGPCCTTTGTFAPATSRCDSRKEYRCTGTGCGADAQTREIFKYCSGTASACTGNEDDPAWTTTACAAGQLCNTDGTTYSSCSATCPFGCLNGACKQCSSGPCCNTATGTFRPATTACDSREEFRCTGTGCGANAQTRKVIKNCSGSSSACTGAENNPAWTTTADCDITGLCETDNTTYSRCGNKCKYGCTARGCTPDQPVYLFATRNKHTPKLGGRAGADSICQQDYNAAYRHLDCDNVRAFLSVTTEDEVRDMPKNYKIPTADPIFLSDGVQIAKNWADMLDQSILQPLSSIVSGSYWTGTNGDGGGAVQTCKGWTVADATDGGTTGSASATDKRWLWGGSWRCDVIQYQFLCVCWSGTP